jgi:hypothetical protein
MIHFNPNSITFELSMPILTPHPHTHAPHIPPLPCCTSSHLIRETSSISNQNMYTTISTATGPYHNTPIWSTQPCSTQHFGTPCLHDSTLLFTPHICSSSPPTLLTLSTSQSEFIAYLLIMFAQTLVTIQPTS